MEGTDVGGGQSPVPVEELDRALDPLRRVLMYALRAGPGSVRYLEANGRRWFDMALALDLPLALRDMLAAARGQLEGLDAETDPAERELRIRSMFQVVERLDAILGLPIPAPRRRGRKSAASEASAAPPKSTDAGAAKSGRRRRGRSEQRGPEPAPVAVQPEETPADDLGDGGWSWNASPSLAELDLDLESVEQLRAAGVGDLGTLLCLRPVRFEPVRAIRGAGRAVEAGLAVIGGRVRWRAEWLPAGGGQDTVVELRGSGPVRARWLGGAPEWVCASLQRGERVVLDGTFDPTSTPPELVGPELVEDDGSHQVRKAIYDLPGCDDRVIRGAIRQVQDQLSGLRDPAAGAASSAGLVASRAALWGSHRGGDPTSRRRLAFDDAALLQLGLAYKRFSTSAERGMSHAVLHGAMARVLAMLDVELPHAAVVALEEVKRDLRHPSPMLRVLDGEVGAGKSLVALLAAVMVAEAKEQVLISAPTPGIAAARFLFMEPLLRELGLVARLFTDAPSRAQIDALRRGEVHVAFGTADMIDPKVTFRRLGLVVAEERGSFGSASTRVRALRSPRPDLLVLPAVPLTTAQLLGPFSDHDVSWMPRGSAPLCEVEILGAAERSSAYAALAQTVANRRQGLVVFPRVRDTDVLDERAAARVVAAMEQQAVPGARVQLLHGSLSREEAFRVFSDFRHHRFDVLVSTVSVQEGPVVPQVDLVVVEQADHMDAVELRRVRGYVAREGARCLMVCGESPAPGAVQRLEQVRDHAGRQLSELFDGDQARCGWLDSDRDHDVLLAARRFAHARLRADPGLRSADSAELARWLIWRWPALSEDACPVPEPLAPSRRPRRRRRRRR